MIGSRKYHARRKVRATSPPPLSTPPLRGRVWWDSIGTRLHGSTINPLYPGKREDREGRGKKITGFPNWSWNYVTFSRRCYFGRKQDQEPTQRKGRVQQVLSSMASFGRSSSFDVVTSLVTHDFRYVTRTRRPSSSVSPSSPSAPTSPPRPPRYTRDQIKTKFRFSPPTKREFLGVVSPDFFRIGNNILG